MESTSVYGTLGPTLIIYMDVIRLTVVADKTIVTQINVYEGYKYLIDFFTVDNFFFIIHIQLYHILTTKG